MSVLPLPTPDRRVVRCANERCNRILRRPPINGLGPECAKAAGFEAPSTARVPWQRQAGPDLFDQLNEGDDMLDLSQIKPLPRQPAYDAVYAVTRQHPPRSTDDYGQVAENARVWRAVEAALDAMGIARDNMPSADEGRLTPPSGTDGETAAAR